MGFNELLSLCQIYVLQNRRGNISLLDLHVQSPFYPQSSGPSQIVKHVLE